MATKKNTPAASLIATLEKSRQAIFKQAATEDGRTLSEAELDRVNALNCVIANSPAENKRDAAIQAGVACEMLELETDDGSAPSDTCVASLNIALRSMQSALSDRRKAA